MSNGITDTDRLDWLERHEANLVTHREQMSEGYSIWWNVAKRNRSVSGHPLGSPRAAIDAAIEQSGETFKTSKPAASVPNNDCFACAGKGCILCDFTGHN